MTNLCPLVNPDVAWRIESNISDNEEGARIRSAANQLKTPDIMSLLDEFRTCAVRAVQELDNPALNEIALNELATAIVSTTRGLFEGLDDSQKIIAIKLNLISIKVPKSMLEQEIDETDNRGDDPTVQIRVDKK